MNFMQQLLNNPALLTALAACGGLGGILGFLLLGGRGLTKT